MSVSHHGRGAPAARPEPFSAYTTPELWDDPHISGRMLTHHLDRDSDLSSRTHVFIDRSVAWMIAALGLGEGSRVLDLGCGPGLYATRLARHGVEVLGIDVSGRSVAHAAAVAREEALPVTVLRGNYLDADLGSGHDAAILIYEDYSALSPGQRSLLLGRVRDALTPGGRFLFDVTAAARFDGAADGRRVEPGLMGGFWSAEPYTGTHETWTYPELRLILDRYTIETAGRTRQFWNWTHCLTPQEVALELGAAGMSTPRVVGDVAGASYDRGRSTFAVLTGRPS